MVNIKNIYCSKEPVLFCAFSGFFIYILIFRITIGEMSSWAAIVAAPTHGTDSFDKEETQQKAPTSNPTELPQPLGPKAQRRQRLLQEALKSRTSAVTGKTLFCWKLLFILLCNMQKYSCEAATAVLSLSRMIVVSLGFFCCCFTKTLFRRTVVSGMWATVLRPRQTCSAHCRQTRGCKLQRTVPNHPSNHKRAIIKDWWRQRQRSKVRRRCLCSSRTRHGSKH